MPIPQNHCIAALVVKDARAAIALYEKALGATDAQIMEGQDGKVIHANFSVQGTTLFINDAMDMMPRKPTPGTQSTGFYVYVDDVDAAYKRAVDAGMTSHFEPTDMFWGDRTAAIEDEFGYMWTLATHTRDVSLEEMEEARKAQGF